MKNLFYILLLVTLLFSCQKEIEFDLPDVVQTIVVEANVLPSDIGFISKEQRAQVKITAYDFSVFGALTGSVSIVGADTITDENGENFYVVKIDLDQDFLEVKNRSLKVIPGMTAQVDIITGKRSPLEYIFSPITKTLQEAFREK